MRGKASSFTKPQKPQAPPSQQSTRLQVGQKRGHEDFDDNPSDSDEPDVPIVRKSCTSAAKKIQVTSPKKTAAKRVKAKGKGKKKAMPAEACLDSSLDKDDDDSEEDGSKESGGDAEESNKVSWSLN